MEESKEKNTQEIPKDTAPNTPEKPKKKWGWLIALLVVIAAAALIFFLFFYKNPNVRNAEQKINAIGQVTLSSEPKIKAAESAVAALTEKELQKVDNVQTLEIARVTYDDLVNQKAAGDVDGLIRSIGTINKDSGKKIVKAREAYDALTDAQKVYVTELAALETAEYDYSVLDVREVEQVILAIQDAAADPEYALPLALVAARTAYESLAPEKRGLVSNYENLVDAEEAYDAYLVTAAQTAIDKAIRTGENYDDAYEKYLNLTEAQQARIRNYGEFSSRYSVTKIAEEKAERLESRNKYIASCKPVTYKQLASDPDAFDGERISFKIRILDTQASTLFKGGRIVGAIVGDAEDNYISIADSRVVKEPELKAGMVITVYGEGDGADTVKNYEEGSGWFGSNLFAKLADTKVIPLVNMKYTDQELAEVDALNSKTTITEVITGVEKGIEIVEDITGIIQKLPWKLF